MSEKAQQMPAPMPFVAPAVYPVDPNTPQPLLPPQAPIFVQPPVQALTAAQIGEQYRSAQFALCAEGKHQRQTKFGVCGQIASIALFPIGLIFLLFDKEVVCSRCGIKLA